MCISTRRAPPFAHCVPSYARRFRLPPWKCSPVVVYPEARQKTRQMLSRDTGSRAKTPDVKQLLVVGNSSGFRSFAERNQPNCLRSPGSPQLPLSLCAECLQLSPAGRHCSEVGSDSVRSEISCSGKPSTPNAASVHCCPGRFRMPNHDRTLVVTGLKTLR